MKNSLSAIVAGAMTLLLGASAQAHISVDGGKGTADATQVVTFNVGHGCEGSDTYSVEITIPASVTSVRPVFGGALGNPTVKKDASGAVTSVVWTKATVEDGDPNFYALQIRMKLPNQPFTTLFFPTTQKCRTAAGVELPPVQWVSTTPSTGENGPEPAPAIVVLPKHSSGWNKFTVPVAITDLTVFDDAQIVWAGNAAYSSNAATKELIGKEPNTTALTTIPAGTEIWVKY